MYVIEDVKDANLRECYGFQQGPNLYLWPEEAFYLLQKGLILISQQEFEEMDKLPGQQSDSVKIVPKASQFVGQESWRLEAADFYSNQRRGGAFLTRSANYQ